MPLESLAVFSVGCVQASCTVIMTPSKLYFLEENGAPLTLDGLSKGEVLKDG